MFGSNRVTGVFDFPKRGLLRLLQAPVTVLYLALGLHLGTLGQKRSNGVPLKEICDKPLRASSGDKLRLFE